MYPSTAQRGNNSHHLCSSNGLTQPSLTFHCQPGLPSIQYSPHFSDEGSEKLVIHALLDRVKVKQVEWVSLAGDGARGADEWTGEFRRFARDARFIGELVRSYELEVENSQLV